MGSLRYPKCENELHFFAVLIFIVFLVKSELKEGICFSWAWKGSSTFWFTDPRSNLGTCQYRPAWRWIRDSGESRQPASDLTCCWTRRKSRGFRCRSIRQESNPIYCTKIFRSAKANQANHQRHRHLDRRPSCCSRSGQSSSLSRDPAVVRDSIDSRASFADWETENRWNRSEIVKNKNVTFVAVAARFSQMSMLPTPRGNIQILRL